MEYILNVPADTEKLKELRAGDSVLLSGTVYTARDAAHKRICEALDRGETPPLELAGSAVYYVGPTPAPESCCIGAAGPTTSGRMDAPVVVKPETISKSASINFGISWEK